MGILGLNNNTGENQAGPKQFPPESSIHRRVRGRLFMTDYSKFLKSLKHLQLQYRNYQTLDSNQPELIQEAVAESVIQRFETCWDSLWKTLKRYLIEEINLPEVPNGPNPILRLANENKLLPSPINEWLTYAQARVNTSHDYSGEKSQEALQLIGSFIDNAIELYQNLSKQKWF